MSQENSEVKTAKFEKFFSALNNEGKDTFVLRGSTLIVEILNEEEIKSKGGIIMQSDGAHKRNSMDENRLHIAKVLMSGEGYEGTDGEDIPCDVQPGAMVILPKYAPQFVSIFPGINEPTHNRICMIKEDQILAYYPSQEAYEKAKEISSR